MMTAPCSSFLSGRATMAYRAWCAAAGEAPKPFEALTEIDRTRWVFVAKALLGNMHIEPEMGQDPRAMVGMIRRMLST